MIRLSAVLVAFALTVPGVRAGDKKHSDVSQIGNRDVGKGLNFYSLEREIALGRQLAQEVARQSKLISDPIITEYINRIGQNLVRNSDAKVPFTFAVIDLDQLNAFALPGGFVFVNSGLIKAAETESELAGAMAHEIAHVAARHITRQMTRSELANFASIPLMVLGGWTGYAIRQGAGAAIPMTFLKFSRGFESEADYLGLQYMYAAGYDPNGAVEMFEKIASLERKKPGTIDRVFSTHPMDTDRMKKAQEEIGEILPARPEYVITTSEYTNVRQRMLDMENRRKMQHDDSRPSLRTAPGAEPRDGDDRPVIKRRDDLVE